MSILTNAIGNVSSFPNAQTWYVDTINGNDTSFSPLPTNYGHSPSMAFETIQTCLTKISYGDIIYLMPGFFTEDPVEITLGVNIIGISAAQFSADVPIASAQFLAPVTVATATFPPAQAQTVSFVNCAFISQDSLPLTLLDTVKVDLQGCLFSYNYTGAIGPDIIPQINCVGNVTLTGRNNSFNGECSGASGTRNVMIFCESSSGLSINLTGTSYNTRRVSNGVVETFFYSSNDTIGQQVIFNNIIHTDNCGQTDTTQSEVFVLGAGANHSIWVNGYNLTNALGTPSPNPTLLLANSDQALAGNSIIINNASIQYNGMPNNQILLANATTVNDTVMVTNGLFNTAGTYTLETTGLGTLVTSYVDGAGVNHAPRNPNGKEWYLDTNKGDDTNNGLSIAAPLASVPALQALASGADIVHVANGSTISAATTLTKSLIFCTDGVVNINNAWTLNVGSYFISSAYGLGFSFNATNTAYQISVAAGQFTMINGYVGGLITNAYATAAPVAGVSAPNGSVSIYMENVNFNPYIQATSSAATRYDAVYLGDGAGSTSTVSLNNLQGGIDRSQNMPYHMFYSEDTTNDTRVVINDGTILDSMTNLNGTSLFAFVGLGTNAAHPITVNTPVYLMDSTVSSTLAPIYLAHIVNAAATARIIVNGPSVALYNGLTDGQVDLGLITGANGQIIVNNGVFATAAAHAMASTSDAKIIATYKDGVGNSYSANSPLNMGAQKITNLAPGVAATDAATVGQGLTASGFETVLLSTATPVLSYTVPTGKSAQLVAVGMVGDVPIVGGAPTISVGTNSASYDNMINALPINPSLSNNTVGMFVFAPGNPTIATSGQQIYFLPGNVAVTGQVSMQVYVQLF